MCFLRLAQYTAAVYDFEDILDLLLSEVYAQYRRLIRNSEGHFSGIFDLNEL